MANLAINTMLFVIFLIALINATSYTLNTNGILLQYNNYYINMNQTTMQANYIAYICNKDCNTGNCFDKWINDSLYYQWYNYNGIAAKYQLDRGHLVPYCDYSDATCTMNNIVPMNSVFNRNGAWRQSENYIRENYNSYLIIKGCEYDYNKFIITPNGSKKLYIPMGCYYVVTDSDNLHSTNFNIIDYGYYYNNNNTCNNKQSKLPFYIKQASSTSGTSNKEKDFEISMDIFRIGFAAVSAVLLFGCIMGYICMYNYLTQRYKRNQEIADVFN